MENQIEFNETSTCSASIGKLALALSKAQAEMLPAVKDKSNPFFKSKYADLSSVWDSIRKPLTKNEISVIQTTGQKNGILQLVTILAHSSGEWIRSEYPITPVKNDPQGVGSAITYARRYSLAALVGVCTDEDDDGTAASEGYSKAEIQRNEINQKFASIDNKKTLRIPEDDRVLDWQSYPFKYRIPEKVQGWNMKQVTASLITNGMRKNEAEGIWYSRKEMKQIEQFLIRESDNQEDIRFTQEDLTN